MTLPILALRGAVVARCAGDSALATLLGGTAAIRDEPPRGEPPVYAVFGPSESRDASATGRSAAEHDLTVRVWAREGSAASGLQAAGRIAELLDDAALSPAGHRLVSLALVATETARDGATGLSRTVLRFRAFTEALA